MFTLIVCVAVFIYARVGYEIGRLSWQVWHDDAFRDAHRTMCHLLFPSKKNNDCLIAAFEKHERNNYLAVLIWTWPLKVMNNVLHGLGFLFRRSGSIAVTASVLVATLPLALIRLPDVILSRLAKRFRAYAKSPKALPESPATSAAISSPASKGVS